MSDTVLSAAPILDRFRLEGRVALVTGAGQGIGRGYAHALGEAGAAVAVVDLDGELASQVVDELADKNIDALAISADVTVEEDIQRMVASVLGRWGRLTIAVNNAGMADWTAAEDVSEENWDKINDLNLKGVFRCAQAEARIMLKAGYGKIINTASMSASVVNTPQKQAVYNTTKAGVLHLTRSLAAEWAPRGIRVNSISPGYTRTKLVEDLLYTPLGQEYAPSWMALTPMGRMCDVPDLQGAVVYLAAPASDFMTGHDMVVDGGYCCW
ncbi:MAG: glucose 1-dehydrogenase [Anaerolineaceae bacterium]|nr:glucose 1-dehydrogenase [Anaerolineaceae bacterium]MCY3906644.1 glucose 1-dehydrogenase [Anaerolineaceae bacterium]